MLGDKLLANNPLIIVDVGASGGLDPRWSNFTNYFKGILFEPDQREYLKLDKNESDNLLILDTALLDLKTQTDFHLCKKQEVSSVFLPNFSLLDKFYEPDRFAIHKTVKLNTDNLDNVLRKNRMNNIDFIKLDTQGSELPILKGSTDSLRNVVGLQIEVNFVELYKNIPLFSDIDIFVRKMGFELFDIKRAFWKRNNPKGFGVRKGQLIWGDALYFKVPEQVLNIDGIDENKVIRTICTYLVYGYVELAESLFIFAKQHRILSNDICKLIKLILVRFTERNPIPNFRGKERIRNMLIKAANFFSIKGPYSGTDDSIGNSL